MIRRLFILTFALLIGCNMSFAQKRKTIDRTSQTTEKKKSTNTTTSSTSSIPTGKSSNSKKQVQKSYLKITPQTVSFGADGGTRTFEVSSSKSWSISVNTAILIFHQVQKPYVLILVNQKRHPFLYLLKI